MEKARLGVVGLGRLGMGHARIIANQVSGAELVAACTLDPAKLDRAASEFEVKRLYSDFDAMISSGDLDGVLIVSPSDLHATQSASALDADLHVFCEKPLGITVEECRDAERSVEDHPDKIFMLGFMRRYDPSYVYAMDAIRSGKIGEPFMVRAYGLDPDAVIESQIRVAPKSGGIMLDLMIHDIDLARWFLGSDFSMVHAIGGSFKYPQFSEFGDVDNAAALMQTTDGKMALFYAGRTAMHGYHVETEVFGTEGSIRIDGVPRKNRAVVYGAAGVTEECVATFPERFEQAFVAELSDFVACIADRRKPEVTVHDGVQATVVGYAATESLSTGKPVYLNQ